MSVNCRLSDRRTDQAHHGIEPGDAEKATGGERNDRQYRRQRMAMTCT
jgi:hypothetical protein